MKISFDSIVSRWVLHLFQGAAEIIEHHLVHLKDRAFSVEYQNVLREGID